MLLKTILISILIPLLFVTTSFAQSAGDLDTTFGDNGLVVTEFPPYESGITALGLQSDNKIIAAGMVSDGMVIDFALARYSNNGLPDTSFGTDGLTITNVSDYQDEIWAIAVQDDDKILAAGYAYTDSLYTSMDVVIVRYKSDGSPDSSFNGTGMKLFDTGAHYEYFHAIVIQPDGKIIAAGGAGVTNADSFILLRFHPDGSIDSTFGTDGIVLTDFGPESDHAEQIVLLPDGKILVAGTAFPDTHQLFALVRYNSNGILDSTFGTDGIATVSFGDLFSPVGEMLVQPDQKILISGTVIDGSHWDFALARCNSDGTPDTSFSENGKLTTNLGTTNDYCSSMCLLPDGKIVLAGDALFGTGWRFALSAYMPDGETCTDFGNEGIVFTNFPGGTSQNINSMILQPDTKILAGGVYSADGGLNYHFALARYFTKPAQGCDSIEVQPGDMNAFTGDDIYFTINCSSVPVAFQWQTDIGTGWIDLSDAGQYSGTNTDSLFVADISLLNNDQHFRCLVSFSECSDTSSVAVLTTTDAVSQFKNEVLVNIYPNPATYKIFLEIQHTENKKFYSCILYDITGSMIYEKSISSNSVNYIDLQNMANGIFLLRIMEDGIPVYTEKIIRN